MGAMGNYTSDKSNGAAKLAFVQTVEHSNPDPYAKTNKVSLLDLHEWTVVTKELQKRGYTVIRFTADEMNTAEIRRVKLKDLSIRTPVVGTRPSITTCLRHLSVLSMEENPPVLEDYPVSLRAFLHRRVKETTFEEIKKLYESVPTFKAFVKPRGPQKVQSWTGCVISSKDEFWKLTNVKDNTPIYVSEPVNFLAEYRCYVIRGSVKAVSCYAGDKTMAPLDLKTVYTAVRCVEGNNQRTKLPSRSARREAPRAYAIDFGVVNFVDD